MYKKTEQEIMRNWKYKDPPLVSVCCVTYNHEPYIRDAIEGFLIQETAFPFEIIIHDDASTDRTADIIREYVEQYPNIIKPIFQTENQYSKGIGIPVNFVWPKARGEYIASCEGDDYWTDPQKLAIQVEYLEENPDVVISSHDAIIIDDKGNLLSNSKLPDAHKRDFTGKELMERSPWLLTMNRVFRNIKIPSIPELSKVINGDAFFPVMIGAYGGSHYHEDIMHSVYRVHKGGVWFNMHNDAKERAEAQLNTYFWIYRYYKRIGNKKYENLFFEKFKERISKRLSVSELFALFLLKLMHLFRIKPILDRLLEAVRNF